MSILTLLTAIWFLSRSSKLKKTKDIKYVWGYPKKVKDVEGYANYYSNIYFIQGILFIIFDIFLVLDKYYFKLPISILTILFFISFALILIESIVIEKNLNNLLIKIFSNAKSPFKFL